jgi:hypothetical protein
MMKLLESHPPFTKQVMEVSPSSTQFSVEFARGEEPRQQQPKGAGSSRQMPQFDPSASSASSYRRWRDQEAKSLPCLDWMSVALIST